jgi:hypothetical protein
VTSECRLTSHNPLIIPLNFKGTNSMTISKRSSNVEEGKPEGADRIINCMLKYLNIYSYAEICVYILT